MIYCFFFPLNFIIFLSCYCLIFFSFYYSFPTVLYTANLLFQQLIMVIKFPCKICNKAVASNHHAVQCDKCYIWVYIKCNKTNLQTYKCLQETPSVWYCIKCFEDIVPFRTISNKELFKTNQGSKTKFTVLTKHHTHLARISLINSMKLWMTLLLKQFPANTTSPVIFHLY